MAGTPEPVAAIMSSLAEKLRPIVPLSGAPIYYAVSLLIGSDTLPCPMFSRVSSLARPVRLRASTRPVRIPSMNLNSGLPRCRSLTRDLHRPLGWSIGFFAICLSTFRAIPTALKSVSINSIRRTVPQADWVS